MNITFKCIFNILLKSEIIDSSVITDNQSNVIYYNKYERENQNFTISKTFNYLKILRKCFRYYVDARQAISFKTFLRGAKMVSFYLSPGDLPVTLIGCMSPK